VFFEKVFVTRPWKALFVTTDDDIREWWSRWRVDRYSVVWGLTFGAGLVALQRIDHIPGTALSSVLALVSLIAYTTFTILCHSVSECEEIHSYVAFIPVKYSKCIIIYLFIINFLYYKFSYLLISLLLFYY